MRLRLHPLRIIQGAPRKTAPFCCRLVILAKAPVGGRVKTRLGREIGTGRATCLYRALLAALLQRLGRQPHWQTLLSVSPDSSIRSRSLPGGADRIVQGGGDIGRRMLRPLEALPPGPVVVIGADIPDVRPDDIRRAFRGLGASDAVFGPAEDGGFWLVGSRRRPSNRVTFGNVRWSTSVTLSDTLAGLRGLSIAMTTTLSDIDEARDLRRLGREPGRRLLGPRRATVSGSAPPPSAR